MSKPTTNPPTSATNRTPRRALFLFAATAAAALTPAVCNAHAGHDHDHDHEHETAAKIAPTPPPAPAKTTAAADAKIAAPATNPAAAKPAIAANSYTLQAIVAQTLALNPELRFYENEIENARTRHETAGRWADPELSVEIGRKSSRNADGTFAGDGLAWGVTLAQRFDFSGRNALRKAIALRQVERAETGLAQFRRELAARSAELAHALLAAQQRLEATEEVAARGRALLATLVQREPAGVAFLLESRILEAAVRKQTRDTTLRRAELNTALAELNMLRGLAPNSPLRIANTTPTPAPSPEDDALLTAAFRDNHSLRQFELDLAEQGIALDLERRNAFNDVTLSAYYNEEKAGGKDRFFGVGVSIPLPLWNRNQPAIAEAKTRQGQAENALFKLRRDLHKDTLAAANLYRANAQAHLENSPAIVARFNEAADLAERHYRLGTIPAATYLDLQQAYLDIVETHTSTRLDALRAAAQLSILTGISLEKFFPEKQTAAPTPPAPAPKTAAPASNEKHDHDADNHDGKHDDHDHAAAKQTAAKLPNRK